MEQDHPPIQPEPNKKRWVISGIGGSESKRIQFYDAYEQYVDCEVCDELFGVNWDCVLNKEMASWLMERMAEWISTGELQEGEGEWKTT